MGRNDEDWAVFWCSLLSPVLLGEIPEAQRERYFQKLSQEERRLPNGQRRCISVRTFRRQWRRLKDGGVPGLYRRRRSDRGEPRKKYADLLARAVELKKEQAYRGARSMTICDAKERRGGNWAFHHRKCAAVGRGTSLARCGLATSNTGRW